MTPRLIPKRSGASKWRWQRGFPGKSEAGKEAAVGAALELLTAGNCGKNVLTSEFALHLEAVWRLVQKWENQPLEPSLESSGARAGNPSNRGMSLSIKNGEFSCMEGVCVIAVGERRASCPGAGRQLG